MITPLPATGVPVDFYHCFILTPLHLIRAEDRETANYTGTPAGIQIDNRRETCTFLHILAILRFREAVAGNREAGPVDRKPYSFFFACQTLMAFALTAVLKPVSDFYL